VLFVAHRCTFLNASIAPHGFIFTLSSGSSVVCVVIGDLVVLKFRSRFPPDSTPSSFAMDGIVRTDSSLDSPTLNE
jgi:hypothetical protein